MEAGARVEARAQDIPKNLQLARGRVAGVDREGRAGEWRAFPTPWRRRYPRSTVIVRPAGELACSRRVRSAAVRFPFR